MSPETRSLRAGLRRWALAAYVFASAYAWVAFFTHPVNGATVALATGAVFALVRAVKINAELELCELAEPIAP